jgi:hypothetical protein
MSLTARISLAIPALALVALFGQPLQASCADAAIVTTVDDTVYPVQRTHIWTEDFFPAAFYPGAAPYSTGGPPFTPEFSAVWWELGRAGANSGANSWDNWIYYKTNDYLGTLYYYGAELFGGWGQGGVADCVQNGACTCVLMTDEFQARGYWAVTAAVRTTLLRQPGMDPAGNASPIVLRRIPAPLILSATRDGVFIILTINVAADSDARLELGGCDCISGYRVMSQALPRNTPAPLDRDVSQWAELPGQPAEGTPLGQSREVALDCSDNDLNYYLTTQIVGQDGFETSKVSENATRVECGFILADPPDPRSLAPHAPRGERLAPRQGRPD